MPTDMDLGNYRLQEAEQLRTNDLLRLLPEGRRSILEIGARDGYHTQLLATRFESVTALDLQKPPFSFDRVIPAQGDVTALEFPDNYFDCVLCAEVLEHVPAVDKAAAEISRVVKHEAVIGVPYRQDTRVGKLSCSSCGKVSPCFGHVNTFDEGRLRTLFHGLQVADVSFIGTNVERTNALSAWLSSFAGNPWGTYDQDEPCIHCGARMHAPMSQSPVQKLASWTAVQLEALQRAGTRPRPSWIHILFRKPA